VIGAPGCATIADVAETARPLFHRRVLIVHARRAAIDAAGAGDRRIAIGDRDRGILEQVVGDTHMLGERIATTLAAKAAPVARNERTRVPTRKAELKLILPINMKIHSFGEAMFGGGRPRR
jgi:hypothetical protein